MWLLIAGLILFHALIVAFYGWFVLILEIVGLILCAIVDSMKK